MAKRRIAVKDHGTRQQLTEEEQVNEFLKCSKSALYFIKNYCKVPHQEYGEIEMGKVIYEKQELFVKAMASKDRKFRYLITNKTRQCGFSTIIGLFSLWYALFHENRNITIVSITDQHAKKFLKDYVQYPYSKLPKWMIDTNDQRVYNNQHELGVYSGSVIRCASGKNAARGTANAFVIVDEVGFIEQTVIEEIWSSVYATTATAESAKIVLNSTSSVAGTWYHDMWEGAINQQTDFVPLEVDWFDVPHLANQKGYLENMRRNLRPESKFRREILREFVVDQGNYIPIEFIDKMAEDQPIRADFLLPEAIIRPDDPAALDLNVDGFDSVKNYIKHLHIWKNPEKNHNYIMGVDVAEGHGNDYSTIQVLDADTTEQVAEYKGKLDTFKFASVVHMVALYYNNSFIIPEANSMGNSVVNKLVIDFEYKNIYMRILPKNISEYGWKTSAGNRNSVLEAYYRAICQENYVLHSKRLKRETQSLIVDGGKIQAAQGTNDDLIMAYALAAYTMQEGMNQGQIYTWGHEAQTANMSEEEIRQNPDLIKNYIQNQTGIEIVNDRANYNWIY